MLRANIILALGLIILFSCCKKKDSEGFRTYKVKGGNHSTNNLTYDISTDKIEFEFILDETAYNNNNPDMVAGVNKIWGGSISFDPQENSARFGFSRENNNLYLVAFVHDEGKMIFVNTDTIQINTRYHCIIQIVDGAYDFYCITTGSHVRIDKKCPTKKFAFQLFPYVGGDFTFDKDFSVKVKKDY